MSQVAVVVIGRNEGARLALSLAAARRQAERVVYVDSGSTDGSPTRAAALGVPVVTLDDKAPYTAGRARNAGVAAVVGRWPQIDLVQVVDGDCELVDGWLTRGAEELVADPHLAVVCGRRRERAPQRSVYHRLADIDWDGPLGDVAACGGDALLRVAAFRQVGGFEPTLIAGEEADLCLRLRRLGWRIRRVDAEMTRHDAAMTHFGQWWRRSRRTGYGYTEGAWRYGLAPEHHWLRESLSVTGWGLALPLAAGVGAYPTRGRSLLLLLAYPVLLGRIVLRERRRLDWRTAALYAAFCILGKFPQAQGGLDFLRARRAARPRLIEDKD